MEELQQQDLQEQTPDTAQEEEQQQEIFVGEEAPKTFTQDEVNEIVRKRLEKQNNKLFGRYGVANRNELDNLIGKVQSYDVMKERYDKIKEENKGLNEKMLFIENNISPNKKDDIYAYFKGKELELNDENLKSLLETHPEWLNEKKPTISKIGNDKGGNKQEPDEKDIAMRLFGLK